jgi:hypothetical protein
MSLQALAATLFSRSDGTWSLTNGGPDCACTPVGSDDITVNHTISIAGAFTLTGSIIVNSGGDLTITGGGSGDLTVDGSGTITVNSGGVLNTDNDMNILGDGVVTVSGDINIGGTLTIDDDGALTVQNGGFIDVGSNFDIESTTNNVMIETGATVHVTDDFSNGSASLVINGDLDIDGDFDNQTNGVITGSGQVTYGGTCDSTGTVNGETGAAVCDGSGVIDLGSLPIELLFFIAEVIEDEVLLTWATASEEGFDYFTVERSTDAQEFYTIGTVPGNGFSESRIDYSFYDANPMLGRSFYRLKANDFDGFVEYFEIATVVFDNRFVKVFPNPTRSGRNIKVAVSLESNEWALLTLHTTLGAEVLRTELNTGMHQIFLPNIGFGLFLLVVQYPGVIQSSMLFVE